MLNYRGTVEKPQDRSQSPLSVCREKEFGSFDANVWQFAGGEPIDGQRSPVSDVPARAVESDALSRGLKKQACRFVGSTIIYTYMQAVGMVNDHPDSCYGQIPRRNRVVIHHERKTERFTHRSASIHRSDVFS
ncbi:MAG: DNA-3-methyladenine glycosylase I [Chlorobium sp.]|uniref:DNA-3-methyladenine glycosylase I n=1 Tax=Chlorobium sp. TaxID=1095 RepID=UPI0025BB9AFB|nr:DNA-3-methyladenine glycosylase I [Chlorobium sp.]MCF8383213.1 DNA-3-methyladenine glycosylase I [Chlorobium sp.]